MAEPFRHFVDEQLPIEAMSRAQVGLVLGLESVLRKAGLVLLCPRCAIDGNLQLDTSNSVEDEIWKIDCRCRRRRSPRVTSMMVPTGWLLQMVNDLLGPLSLDVRCPSRRCLLKPLQLRQSLDGMTLTVTCHCGREYKFNKTRTSKPN